jgi:drug/metabolite transporter, DME family
MAELSGNTVPRARTSRPARSTDRAALAAAAVAAVLFGSGFAATSIALRSFDPVAAAFWRATVGAIPLAPIVLFRSRASDPTTGQVRLPVRARAWRSVVLGLGGPIFLAGMSLAVAELGAAVTAFVVGLYAIFAALLSRPLLGERVPRATLAGLIAALLGTTLLVELDLTPRAIGVATALGSAVAYSAYIVLGRRWSRPWVLPPELISLTTVLLTTVGLAAWLAATNAAAFVPSAVRPEELAAIGWLGAVLVLGQSLLMASLRRVDARRSAGMLLLNPVSATVFAAILVGERLGPAQLAGGALVLAGIGVAVWNE